MKTIKKEFHILFFHNLNEKNNNKWIKYKTFELNYVDKKLSSVWKDK